MVKLLIVFLLIGSVAYGMEIKGGETLYEKAKDKNIVYQFKLDKQEIHLDILQEQIVELNSEIDSISKPKNKPDKETMDFWNEFNTGLNKEDLEEERDEKQNLLDLLNNLQPVK